MKVVQCQELDSKLKEARQKNKNNLTVGRWPPLKTLLTDNHLNSDWRPLKLKLRVDQTLLLKVPRKARRTPGLLRDRLLSQLGSPVESLSSKLD